MDLNHWQSLFGDQLDKKQLAIFLQKAKNEFTSSYPTLKAQLEQSAWHEAAAQAHHLKALVKFLSIEALLPYLLAIEKQEPIIKTPDFQLSFQQQYQDCLQQITTNEDHLN